MEVQTLKIVYFSPTGTTKSIVQQLASYFPRTTVEFIDINTPKARTVSLSTEDNDLLVVAVPVYMGRVPAIVHDWLCSIHANNTPAVGIAVYGNRTYGDTLLELKHIFSRCGCVPIACAAFIGEHSFSTIENPTAQGRPDSSDLRLVDDFCRRLSVILSSYTKTREAYDLELPGKYPYEGSTQLWDVDFMAVTNACTLCGVCAEICPAGAITGRSLHVNSRKCITCCACIKNCPQSARIMKAGPVKDASMRLHTLYSERKEPEFYFITM